jgi:23S rRNA (cytosine1962-C5)-methyltransferase
MFARDQYQLLDFGQGRKLERFGPWVLDRPAPAADDAPQLLSTHAWRQATAARYERIDSDRGKWSFKMPVPQCWDIDHGKLTFGLKLTEFGHLLRPVAARWRQRRPARR